MVIIKDNSIHIKCKTFNCFGTRTTKKQRKLFKVTGVSDVSLVQLVHLQHFANLEEILNTLSTQVVNFHEATQWALDHVATNE